MTRRSNVTQPPKSVTETVTDKRDSLARARTPYGGDVTVSRVTPERDVTRDKRLHHRDMTSRSLTRDVTSHHGYVADSRAVSWVHLAALNILDRVKAGEQIPEYRIEAARKALEGTGLEYRSDSNSDRVRGK